MRCCARTLWCAVLVAIAARAAAYTVDCNHEYTDCDTELSKLTDDEDTILQQSQAPSSPPSQLQINSPTTVLPTSNKATNTPNIEINTKRTNEKDTTKINDITESIVKPKPRLLNLSVDDLQNFANALHNRSDIQGKKKTITDLSDVNLDGDDDDVPAKLEHEHKHDKHIPDKFYSNLQAPFNPLLSVEELEACKENEIFYKIGDRIDRGCEESCECMPGGTFECSPRCKHPYIRKGRRLNDPLCFESPVDECCSIIACATGENKGTTIEVCRYGNDTYPVGGKWNVGCEQSCTCEKNSVVTCKPRCSPLPHNDKCINVQDPNDECCEVQVCDVSQDAHEEQIDNSTSSTSTTESSQSSEIEHFLPTIPTSSTIRPLSGLTEPIGSVKVLQNNSVQVNLIHPNNSDAPIHLLLSSNGGKSFEEVELKYSNLILNLEGGKDYILKSKETDTKFNFTITASDFNGHVTYDNISKMGCQQNGKFYEVGEEFHIGCSELCECTGHNTRECAVLECPSHVGLELVFKGCVRWAPSPPPEPPNCCPRTAKCLSDGTCHYKDVAIPNWTEVPISLTGCEQRCFCENGELDCQEVCTPLPPVPPQTFRCPPLHRPAPVNISDEDCCKQWGCLPNAVDMSGSNYKMPTLKSSIANYVMPISPILPTTIIPMPSKGHPFHFYNQINPMKTIPKYLKTVIPVPVIYETSKHLKSKPESNHMKGQNITVFTLDDIDSPFKTIQPEPPYSGSVEESKENKIEKPILMNPYRQPYPISNIYFKSPIHTNTLHTNNKSSDNKFHNIIMQKSSDKQLLWKPNSLMLHENPNASEHEDYKTLNYFSPVYDKYDSNEPNHKRPLGSYENKAFFPAQATQSYFFPSNPAPSSNPATLLPFKGRFRDEAIKGPRVSFNLPVEETRHSQRKIKKPTDQITNKQPQFPRGKHVTVLRNKDVKFKESPDTMHTSIDSWHSNNNIHVLTKAPNPYETVLLRPVPNAKVDLLRDRFSDKPYSTLDLEHLLSQMEVETVVNRNLGRSADKTATAAGQTPISDFTTNPSRPQQPSFLPTVPPEIHYPQEDIPDYDQNNIHRPVNTLPGLPPPLPMPPNYGEENKKLSVISIQADSPSSVKMLFGLPPVLVGLRGSVDLRYTDKADEDISHWYSQVFAPADEILTTSRLEFRLTGLKPSTTYKIRGKLYLHNLPVEPESEVHSVRTLDLPSVIPVEEKRREIDSRLTVVDVNDTVAHVSWRHFTEEELQFIDGIQVRYRPIGTPIYIMTELLHHSRSAAELHDLRAGSRYEASLVLIPPPRSVTELHDPGKVEFTTLPYVDPYNWTVTVEARAVGSEAAELTWRGVPSPAERWVRVYRAAHACGGSRREHDAFRLAARDLPPTVTLTGLEPNTRCRVWLELFLTNGKVKTSNVLEINTKSLDSPEPIDNVIEASSVGGGRVAARGDYYGALVVVGVVAALGALTSLLLLLVVVRRHRPRSVPITPVPSAPRESSLPPYDNPAYKLELQQETMDL